MEQVRKQQHDEQRYSLYFLDVCGVGIAFLVSFVLKNGWEFVTYPPQFIFRYFLAFILMTMGILGLMGRDVPDLRLGKMAGIMPVLPQMGILCLAMYPMNYLMSVAYEISGTLPILLWFIGVVHLVGIRIIMMMYWEKKDLLKKEGLWGRPKNL